MWVIRQKELKLTARKFTRKYKFIVRLRARYGMWGLVILSPVILSIPVGGLLGNKYFRHNHHFMRYMVLSIIVWGIVSVTFFSTFMNH
jgi:hypothetical protein